MVEEWTVGHVCLRCRRLRCKSRAGQIWYSVSTFLLLLYFLLAIAFTSTQVAVLTWRNAAEIDPDNFYILRVI